MTAAVADAPTGTVPPFPVASRSEDLVRETVAHLRELPEFRGGAVAEVEVLAQRSLCLRVRFADGRRVFVKRTVPGPGRAPRGSVAHEAAVLARLHPLGLPVPRPVATLAGARSAVLVTEDVGGLGTLGRCRAAAGGTSPGWLGAVGRALATVHTGVTPARLPRTDPARRLLCSWTAVRTGLPSTPQLDRFGRHLRAAGLVDLLEQAAARYAPASLVHGDVRADNVLCLTDPDQPRPVRFVDWETAGLGDPRWDVGCLIGDLLAGWVGTLHLARGTAPEDWAAAAGTPFDAVVAEVRALVTGYTALRPTDEADRHQWLRSAAFVLVERAAAEVALEGLDLPPRALAGLSLAGQLLRRPEGCAELLYP